MIWNNMKWSKFVSVTLLMISRLCGSEESIKEDEKPDVFKFNNIYDEFSENGSTSSVSNDTSTSSDDLEYSKALIGIFGGSASTVSNDTSTSSDDLEYSKALNEIFGGSPSTVSNDKSISSDDLEYSKALNGIFGGSTSTVSNDTSTSSDDLEYSEDINEIIGGSTSTVSNDTSSLNDDLEYSKALNEIFGGSTSTVSSDTSTPTDDLEYSKALNGIFGGSTSRVSNDTSTSSDDLEYSEALNEIIGGSTSTVSNDTSSSNDDLEYSKALNEIFGGSTSNVSSDTSTPTDDLEYSKALNGIFGGTTSTVSNDTSTSNNDLEYSKALNGIFEGSTSSVFNDTSSASDDLEYSKALNEIFGGSTSTVSNDTSTPTDDLEYSKALNGIFGGSTSTVSYDTSTSSDDLEYSKALNGIFGGSTSTVSYDTSTSSDDLEYSKALNGIFGAISPPPQDSIKTTTTQNPIINLIDPDPEKEVLKQELDESTEPSSTDPTYKTVNDGQLSAKEEYEIALQEIFGIKNSTSTPAISPVEQESTKITTTQNPILVQLKDPGPKKEVLIQELDKNTEASSTNPTNKTVNDGHLSAKEEYEIALGEIFGIESSTSIPVFPNEIKTKFQNIKQNNESLNTNIASVNVNSRLRDLPKERNLGDKNEASGILKGINTHADGDVIIHYPYKEFDPPIEFVTTPATPVRTTTDDGDNEDDTDNCKYERPLSKPKVDRSGRTVAEIKCEEQMWDKKYLRDEENYLRQCIRQNEDDISSVIGGSDSQIGEFPHMGAVGWMTVDNLPRFFCGATLITSMYSVTAAHCRHRRSDTDVTLLDEKPKFVRFGVVNIDDEDAATDAIIDEFITPENYNAQAKRNDIALIRFTEAIKFSKYIQPACLWHTTKNSLEIANITGWGLTVPDVLNSTSSILKYAEVGIISDTTCDTLWNAYYNRNFTHLSDDQLCAGKLEGGKDTCQGDSGGPLQIWRPFNHDKDVTVHYVVGVVSFGKKCGQAKLPGIYTEINKFRCWIEKIVWPEEKNDLCP